MKSLQTICRLCSLTLIALGLFGAWGGPTTPVAAQSASPTVIVLTFRGPVTPVLERYLNTGINRALEQGAAAVVLRLDTPGGSVNVTKNITQRMLAAPVPIVVYVAPSGATAGSAGTFVTLAGHVAAMAPDTSIGAASPVGGQGEDIGETMQAKVENILSADIENLADRRGDAATEWAIAAVREARAATAHQALDLGVIDFVADNVDDLLTQMDGFVVDLNGVERSLETAGAQQLPVDLTPIERFLNFISDPTIASLLLSLGILGLIIEIRTPGIGVPGVVGAISLLMAFYALGQLDANFVGIALIGLAAALFVAEAFTPTFGILAVGGIAAFIFGAFLLFNETGYPVPWPAIITLAVVMGAITIWIGAKAMAAQRRPVITGSEALIGQTARVQEAFRAGDVGHVFVAGELWNAKLDQGEAAAGDRVRITGRDGYTLNVRLADEQ